MIRPHLLQVFDGEAATAVLVDEGVVCRAQQDQIRIGVQALRGVLAVVSRAAALTGTDVRLFPENYASLTKHLRLRVVKVDGQQLRAVGKRTSIARAAPQKLPVSYADTQCTVPSHRPDPSSDQHLDPGDAVRVQPQAFPANRASANLAWLARLPTAAQASTWRTMPRSARSCRESCRFRGASHRRL